LLLSALNYLAWADFSEQRYEGPDVPLVERLYEKARLQLATLMERHGRSDSYLELMLVYLIRTERYGGKDKLGEIRSLAEYFIGNRKSTWSAATLAELGDYLLGRNETEHVNAILLAAVNRDGSMPEAHAAMARWNRRSGFPQDELKALEFAARFFAETDAKSGLSIKRTKRYMDTLIRLGELRRENGRSLDAEDSFNQAIERYEQALSGLQLRRDPQYGKAYALLADIYYSERMDFDGALRLYSQAEANGWITPETDYRRGYIGYMRPSDDGTAALKFFYRAGLDANASPYLQWATANALYARGDYFAAQGYLSMLADRLQFELDTLALPSPQVKPSHAEIVELLTMTRNNLGAALYRVAERMGDARRRADAMVEFTESARLYDSLSRDQTSMIRSESKNLGFLNLDFVLHPLRGIDLGLYRTIPTEMTYPKK
jgi:tetratricopeptide (TPR) repeat protein